MQLSNESDLTRLPETTVLLGLLARDTEAVVTFIDLVNSTLFSMCLLMVFLRAYQRYQHRAWDVADTARPSQVSRRDGWNANEFILLRSSLQWQLSAPASVQLGEPSMPSSALT